MQLKELIEKAALIAGSEYKIAKSLAIPQSHITEWKHGTRSCSAEDRALLADLAGVDPFPEIKEAMLDRWAGKPKAEALAKVWAKWGEHRIFPRKLARFAARVQALILEPMRNA